MKTYKNLRKTSLYKKILETKKDMLSNFDLLNYILLFTVNNAKMIEEIKSDQVKISVGRFLNSDIKLLQKNYGIKKNYAVLIYLVAALSYRFAESDTEQPPQIITPLDALTHLWDIRDKKQEYFVGLYLNARNHLISKEVISVGTLNASIVHPRDVFYKAIKLNSASVIVAHNHPSGDPAPSEADIDSTKQLYNAGEIVGIKLIDHIVVSSKKYISMKSEGHF